MKSFLACLLVLNPFGYAQTASPAKPPFTVTISADHPTPRVGEPLMIHIVLESVSRDPITIAQERHIGTRGEFNYRITMIHVDGSAVPDTEEGYRLKHGTYAGEWSTIDKPLQLGERREEEADLNDVVVVFVRRKREAGKFHTTQIGVDGYRPLGSVRGLVSESRMFLVS